jgi:cholesterol transport system auxiliary component
MADGGWPRVSGRPSAPRRHPPALAGPSAPVRRSHASISNPRSSVRGPQSSIRNHQSAIGLVLLVVLAWLVGGVCGCAQSLPPRRYYLVEAPRPPASAPAAPDAVLRVGPFRMEAAFTGRQLVYRVSEFRYETDYYHQFLVTPEVMLSEQTRDWLVDAGLFRQVVASDGPAAPTYTLTGTVTALYGDFRVPAAPLAVLEIRWTLVGPAPGRHAAPLVWTVRAASPIADRTADAVVAALSDSLAQVLTQLADDLRRQLTDPALPHS